MMIRIAREDDLPQLIQMYNSLYDILTGTYRYPFSLKAQQNETALKTRINSKFFHILVAQEDGMLLGFVLGSISRLDPRMSDGGKKTIGRIDDLYICPQKRGCGIANRLMDAVEDWFRGEEVAMVESYIVDGNIQSLEFHKKCGYKPVSQRVMKRID